MKQKFSSMLILAFLLLYLSSLFWSSTYIIFILAYVFVFVFLICHAAITASTILEKIAQMIVYGLVMVAQILFDVFVVRTMLNVYGMVCNLGKILGIGLIFIPFFVKRFFFFEQHRCASFTIFGECSVLSYSQFLHNREEILHAAGKMAAVGRKLSKSNIQEIIHNLPRHSSSSYVNNGTLTESYFREAADALHDGYIYLVITKSKSASSEVIGLFTNKQYNHVSLSFDRELHTIISYNGGEKIAPPGLNSEVVEQLIRREGASIIVYRLSATYEQKQTILDRIRQINNEGSAYNLLGLVLKDKSKPNIMFCSQFVYTMLEFAGLNYFEKDAVRVIPADFIELDYYRNLDFVSIIS